MLYKYEQVKRTEKLNFFNESFVLFYALGTLIYCNHYTNAFIDYYIILKGSRSYVISL